MWIGYRPSASGVLADLIAWPPFFVMLSFAVLTSYERSLRNFNKNNK